MKTHYPKPNWMMYLAFVQPHNDQRTTWHGNTSISEHFQLPDFVFARPA